MSFENEARKRHGYVSSSSNSESGKSEFDEEYFALQPPPVPISELQNVVVIQPQIKEPKENVGVNKEGQQSLVLNCNHYEFDPAGNVQALHENGASKIETFYDSNNAPKQPHLMPAGPKSKENKTTNQPRRATGAVKKLPAPNSVGYWSSEHYRRADAFNNAARPQRMPEHVNVHSNVNVHSTNKNNGVVRKVHPLPTTYNLRENEVKNRPSPSTAPVKNIHTQISVCDLSRPAQKRQENIDAEKVIESVQVPGHKLPLHGDLRLEHNSSGVYHPNVTHAEPPAPNIVTSNIRNTAVVTPNISTPMLVSTPNTYSTISVQSHPVEPSRLSCASSGETESFNKADGCCSRTCSIIISCLLCTCLN